MNAVEQQIAEKIKHLDATQQQRVLEFVESIAASKRHYTARELMRLPLAERNAILREQLIQSANEDFETFEAYSEEDLDALP